MDTQEKSKLSPLDSQVGGNYYKDLAIQPVELFFANRMNFVPASIVKYLTRFRAKNGRQDLEKALHFLEMLIEKEYHASQELLAIKTAYHWISSRIIYQSWSGFKINPSDYCEKNEIEPVPRFIICKVCGYEKRISILSDLIAAHAGLRTFIDGEYPEENRYPGDAGFEYIDKRPDVLEQIASKKSPP